MISNLLHAVDFVVGTLLKLFLEHGDNCGKLQAICPVSLAKYGYLSHFAHKSRPIV